MADVIIPLKNRLGLMGASILIFSLVFALYLPVLDFGLVILDDHIYLERSGLVNDGLTVSNVRKAFTSLEHDYWIPVLWLSYMLDVSLFGFSTLGFHLTNVILHCLNAVLFFLVLRTATGRTRESLLGSLLFALHPLRVEAVAWVTARKDVLSVFFFLLGLLAYIHYTRRSGMSRYLLAGAFFTLGLMSKPMLVTFPVLLLILDFWPLERVKPPMDGISEKTDHRRWRMLVWEKVPFLILSLVFSCLTLWTQHAREAIVPMGGVSPWFRLQTAFSSYLIYLRKAFWPSDLGLEFYGISPEYSLSAVLFAFLFLVAMSFMALRLFGNRPYIAVGWFWYLIALVPVSGFITVGSQPFSDRFTYLPQMMLGIALVWFFCGDGVMSRGLKRLSGTSLVVVCFLLAFLARQQLFFWRDSETLFRRAVAIDQWNFQSNALLADSLVVTDKLPEAEVYYLTALKIYPGFAEGHLNFGALLAKREKYDQAVFHLNESLRLSPGLGMEVHVRLADIYFELGAWDKAREHYRAFVAHSPPEDGLVHAYTLSGIALDRMGRSDEAIASFKAGLRLRSDDANLHYNLGVVYSSVGRTGLAADHYRQAIELDPEDIRPRVNLAELLLSNGLLEQANTHFQSVADRFPDSAEGLFSLGRILEMEGNPVRAREMYDRSAAAPSAVPEAQSDLKGVLSRSR